MSNYISPWYCIAVSGETRDGRVIKPEWLIDADQTYDANNAEALLWYEHSRWYDPGGAVYRTKHDATDGVVKLYAQLRPSAALMQYAAQNEVPFRFSVELRPRGDGKMYLDGLAYTHSPASMGVDRMEFSQAKPEVQLTEFIEVPKLEFIEQRQGFWDRLFSSPRIPAQHRATPPTPVSTFSKMDDDVMTPEQLSLLQQQISQQFSQQFAQLTEELKSIKADLAEVKKTNLEYAEKMSGAVKLLEETREGLENLSVGGYRRKPATGQGIAVSFKDFGIE